MVARIALCLLKDRIAPRYDRSEQILLVTVRDLERHEREFVPVGRQKPEKVCNMLVDRNVGTLICGGVTDECRTRLERSGIRILDNVIGSVDGVIAVFLGGHLVSGCEVD